MRIIKSHLNTKETLNHERLTGIAIACMLVFAPVSLASQNEESAYGEPDFRDVKLWEYNVDIRAIYDYFWTATNPSKYIMPGNPIIHTSNKIRYTCCKCTQILY